MPNFFFSFPVVPASAGGPQAAIDLFAVAPPTGLDPEITFICTGEFEGALAIEGSADGVDWDVLTQFTVGKDADLLAGPRLELSPIVASATVRFLRVNSKATVRTATTITAGASQNCACETGEEPMFETVTNASGSDFVVGEVVRMSGDDAVTRSQADTPANAQGTIGVTGAAFANGAPGPVVTEGKTTVLLEAGLLGVAAGQTLWVSPTVAGRATNLKPIGVGEAELAVGIIKIAAGYAVDNTVIADVDPDAAPKIAGLVASTQCGKVVFAGETTKAVLFPVAFPAGVEPAVVLTPIAQLGSTVTPNLDGVTTNTGFTILMSTPYTGAVYWIACTD
jgi:hypothetical protein